LNRKRDGPALNDLFVKKFQRGLWFQPDFFQDGFDLAFQFGVNPAFGDCAHVPIVAQTWPVCHPPKKRCLVQTFGDLHWYSNPAEQASRRPLHAGEWSPRDNFRRPWLVNGISPEFSNEFEQPPFVCAMVVLLGDAQPKRRGRPANLAMKMKGLIVKNGAVISVAGLMLGGSGAAVFAQTNLVANGSFEAGPAGEGVFTDWSWLGPASNNSDYGVAHSSTYPEVAEQGDYYAYFRGHPTDSSQDCLGTTVNLQVGALYNISYYLATDGSTWGNGAAMWAVIGTSFGIDLSQDVLLTAFFPNSSNAIPYQKFSTNYVATIATPILSFHGVNATNGIAATSAILLDNVSLTLSYPPLNLGYGQPNSLVFTWPLTNSPYRLQAAASLIAPFWVTLTNEPVTVGASSQIVLPAPASMQFYRLALP
jgi:hypothetical protein